MAKIRVLHIIKSLGRGGAEMLLPETLKLHNKERFEFFYIYFLPWKDQMVEAIEECGGKVDCFSANNNFLMLKKYKQVRIYCEKNKIDLIHCHLPWSGFLGRIIFSRTKIPVIYTEHNIQERYHPITKLINKVTYNHQSIAIGVSSDATLSIKENLQPTIPVRTVLNGVNTDNFIRNENAGSRIRKKFNIPESAIVIGNIAVFREQKAIPDWIRAFKVISERNGDVYGILVGAGQQEDEIKQMIQEMNLEKKIKLPGLQTDTISYFSAMDIFMMSSLFEGLPIALLEAMSMKCAVVSTKAGGVVEVIRNNVEGLLCEPEDWEKLALLAEELVVDSNKRKKMGLAARERVKDSFSLQAMVTSLEEVYEEVL